jgi:hypothetical protein
MNDDSPATLAAAPPDPRGRWTAEIAWHQRGREGRFSVVARPAGAGAAEDAVVAESGPLEWPPQGPASVQALADAASELEAALAGAGWRRLAPGRAWYAKRFAWDPVGARADEAPPSAAAHEAAPPAHEAAPAPAPGAGAAARSPAPATAPAGPFARAPAWPDGARERWRCEVAWDAGWVESRFEARGYAPRRRSGRPIAASAALRWLLMGSPDPESAAHGEALRALEAELERSGWEPAGRGADWYSTRFSWPLGDPPPLGADAHRSAHRAGVGKPARRTYTTTVKGHSPHDLERLMRAARPTPRPEFVARLESSLAPRPVRRDRRVLRVAIAGAAFAAVLVAVAVAMSVGGLLPLTSGGSPASAGEDCRNVVIHPTERHAYFVRDRNGDLHVRYRDQVVRRVVKRCR